jgi:hypothetical protein
MEINCSVCGKIINKPPSRIKRAKHHYCSLDCRFIGQVGESRAPASEERKKKIRDKLFKGFIVKCETCETPFRVSRGNFGKNRYCSRKCYKNKVRVEETILSNIGSTGYYETSQKRLAHRVIVENFIGRSLTRQENVHHINEIRTDNRIENLYLFSSRSEHMAYHQQVKFRHREAITESNLYGIRLSESL